MPFYVDRPVELTGAFLTLIAASSTGGKLIRAGIYDLGAPAGSNWEPGTLVHDFGTQSTDMAGHFIADTSAPILLSPG